MSAMVEVLSFLGPLGPVAREAHACVFYDSKHAAGVCLGTVLVARTLLPTVISESPAQATIYHSARPQ